MEFMPHIFSVLQELLEMKSSIYIAFLSLTVESSPSKFRRYLDCDCGERKAPEKGSSLMEVGNEATRNEFPWAVSYLYHHNSNHQFLHHTIYCPRPGLKSELVRTISNVEEL